MCLAVPGKVIEIQGDKAKIDYGGVIRDANISLVPAKVGDYVVVHAGFAIEIMDEVKVICFHTSSISVMFMGRESSISGSTRPNGLQM